MDPWGINHPGRDVRQVGPEGKRGEDSRNGLMPMPGGGNEFGGGVRYKNDGNGDFLQGEAEGLGTVYGVQKGDGARVAGGPSIDAEWEGNGWETELGNHGPQRGSTYLQDGFPNRRGTSELPRQGVTGTVSDKNDNAGSFIPLSWTGYHNHFGGGKPNPPMVPPMRHAGVLAYTEQEAPHQCLVRQGKREEVHTAGGGGYLGEFG